MITESALKEFKDESKKWIEDGLGFLTTPIKYVELLELTERLIAAEKDAARYRWLRDTSGVDGTADLMISIIASDEWDSLINEEIQCSK